MSENTVEMSRFAILKKYFEIGTGKKGRQELLSFKKSMTDDEFKEFIAQTAKALGDEIGKIVTVKAG